MTVPFDKTLMILTMLIEGTSIRGTERITGINRDTICRLLVLAGEKCERIMAKKVRNVRVRDIEADEVWSYIAKKEKRVEIEDNPSLGGAYVFVAIERNTKLVLNVTIGKRNQQAANVFIEGVRDAIAPGRFQMTTDGFASHRTAVPDTFADRVDFAQLITVYRAVPEGWAQVFSG